MFGFKLQVTSYQFPVACYRLLCFMLFSTKKYANCQNNRYANAKTLYRQGFEKKRQTKVFGNGHLPYEIERTFLLHSF